MKKLLLLLSILTFSFGAFATNGDLCDADSVPGKTITCTAEMIAGAKDDSSDPCHKASVGESKSVTVE